jgi:CubicO group peptidase (beta-lactamase class C family)
MTQATFTSELSNILSIHAAQDEFTGAVFVAQEGHKIFELGYGYANRAWRIHNSAHTRFRIASISKLFTALAIFQLIERNMLSLSTPLLEILTFPKTEIPYSVTIKHLLTMTSGIADWFDESGDWEANWQQLITTHPIYLFRENIDYLPLFIDASPLSPVGQCYQYNGAGYILLGLVIEEITGQSYFKYVTDEIFNPLGMHATAFIALDEPAYDVAEGYIKIEQAGMPTAWQRNIYSTTPQAAADGGATSTLNDLFQFSKAIRAGLTIAPELADEFLTPQVQQFENTFRNYFWYYGYANNFLLNEQQEIIRWGHTGEEDGVSCRLFYFPRQDVDAIILGNQSWCAGKLGWEIHDLILNLL